jgi:hypothetical protein
MKPMCVICSLTTEKPKRITFCSAPNHQEAGAAANACKRTYKYERRANSELQACIKIHPSLVVHSITEMELNFIDPYD